MLLIDAFTDCSERVVLRPTSLRASTAGAVAAVRVAPSRAPACETGAAGRLVATKPNRVELTVCGWSLRRSGTRVPVRLS